MRAEEPVRKEEIARIESDIEWTAKNFRSLAQAYEGRYIAVKGGSVIADADDFEKLLNKLKQMKIDPRRVHIDSIAPRSFACIL